MSTLLSDMLGTISKGAFLNKYKTATEYMTNFEKHVKEQVGQLNERPVNLDTEIYICIGHSLNTSVDNDVIANTNTVFIIADTCGYLYNVYLTFIAIVCSALFIKYNISRDIIDVINFISKQANINETVKFAKQIKSKQNNLLLDAPDPINADNILVYQSGLIKITSDTRLKGFITLTPYSDSDKRIGIKESYLTFIYPPETIFPPQDLITYAFNSANDIKDGYKDYNHFKYILGQEITRHGFGNLNYIDMYLSHISSINKYIIEVNCRGLGNNYATRDDLPDTRYPTLTHMRSDNPRMALARQNSISIDQSSIVNIEDCTWKFNHEKRYWECFKIIDGRPQIYALSSNPNARPIYKVYKEPPNVYFINKQIDGKDYKFNIETSINKLVDFSIFDNQNTTENGHFLLQYYNDDLRPYWSCVIHNTGSYNKECSFIGGYFINKKKMCGSIVKTKRKCRKIRKKQKTNKNKNKKNRTKNKTK